MKTTTEPFRYDGKRVLVVGGATGMGAAAAKRAAALGGEAVVMDYTAVPCGPCDPGGSAGPRRRRRRDR